MIINFCVFFAELYALESALENKRVFRAMEDFFAEFLNARVLPKKGLMIVHP